MTIYNTSDCYYNYNNFVYTNFPQPISNNISTDNSNSISIKVNDLIKNQNPMLVYENNSQPPVGNTTSHTNPNPTQSFNFSNGFFYMQQQVTENPGVPFTNFGERQMPNGDEHFNATKVQDCMSNPVVWGQKMQGQLEQEGTWFATDVNQFEGMPILNEPKNTKDSNEQAKEELNTNNKTQEIWHQKRTITVLEPTEKELEALEELSPEEKKNALRRLRNKYAARKVRQAKKDKIKGIEEENLALKNIIKFTNKKLEKIESLEERIKSLEEQIKKSKEEELAFENWAVNFYKQNPSLFSAGITSIKFNNYKDLVQKMMESMALLNEEQKLMLNNLNALFSQTSFNFN